MQASLFYFSILITLLLLSVARANPTDLINVIDLTNTATALRFESSDYQWRAVGSSLFRLSLTFESVSRVNTFVHHCDFRNGFYVEGVLLEGSSITVSTSRFLGVLASDVTLLGGSKLTLTNCIVSSPASLSVLVGAESHLLLEYLSSASFELSVRTVNCTVAKSCAIAIQHSTFSAASSDTTPLAIRRSSGDVVVDGAYTMIYNTTAMWGDEGVVTTPAHSVILENFVGSSGAISILANALCASLDLGRFSGGVEYWGNRGNCMSGVVPEMHLSSNSPLLVFSNGQGLQVSGPTAGGTPRRLAACNEISSSASINIRMLECADQTSLPRCGEKLSVYDAETPRWDAITSKIVLGCIANTQWEEKEPIPAFTTPSTSTTPPVTVQTTTISTATTTVATTPVATTTSTAIATDSSATVTTFTATQQTTVTVHTTPTSSSPTTLAPTTSPTSQSTTPAVSNTTFTPSEPSTSATHPTTILTVTATETSTAPNSTSVSPTFPNSTLAPANGTLPTALPAAPHQTEVSIPYTACQLSGAGTLLALLAADPTLLVQMSMVTSAFGLATCDDTSWTSDQFNVADNPFFIRIGDNSGASARGGLVSAGIIVLMGFAWLSTFSFLRWRRSNQLTAGAGGNSPPYSLYQFPSSLMTPLCYAALLGVRSATRMVSFSDEGSDIGIGVIVIILVALYGVHILLVLTVWLPGTVRFLPVPTHVHGWKRHFQLLFSTGGVWVAVRFASGASKYLPDGEESSKEMTLLSSDSNDPTQLGEMAVVVDGSSVSIIWLSRFKGYIRMLHAHPWFIGYHLLTASSLEILSSAGYKHSCQARSVLAMLVVMAFFIVVIIFRPHASRAVLATLAASALLLTVVLGFNVSNSQVYSSSRMYVAVSLGVVAALVIFLCIAGCRLSQLTPFGGGARSTDQSETPAKRRQLAYSVFSQKMVRMLNV